jgi:MFS family permease
VRKGQWLGALGERDFRLLFIARVTSFVGTGMLPVALSFAILDRGGSTTQVGLVLGAETVPLVLFLLVGGVVADRLNRRVVMVGADALRAVAQTALAVWLLTGDPPIWGFLLLEALVGTGTAFFTPALTGLVPQLVPDPNLHQANALNGMAEWTGTLVGPAIAGIVVAVAGAGWAVAADAMSYAVSALCLAAMGVGWARGHIPTEPFVRQLREGWRAFRSRRWLWVIVLQFSLFGLFVFAPFFVLGSVVARDSLGGAAVWGAILAAQGAGSVLGSIVMLRVQPRRPLLVLELFMLAWVLPLVALAIPARSLVVGAAAFVSGWAFGVLVPLWDTTMQRELPADVLSRASAYDWFGSLVFLPIGYAVAGPLASLIGDEGMLLLGAAWVAVTVAIVVALPGVTRAVGRAAPAAAGPESAGTASP